MTYGLGVKTDETLVANLEKKLNKIKPTKIYNYSQPRDDIINNYTKYKTAKENKNPTAYSDSVIIRKFCQKTQNKLWKKTLKIKLTKKSMTEEESLPLINKKTVKNFIMECFSKSRSNEKR